MFNKHESSILQRQHHQALCKLELFLDGHSYERGARTVTALGHFLARTSSLGDRRIPRSARALKGRRVSSPASQRLPMPRAATLAIVGVLAMEVFLRMDLWIALAFVCCPCPSETMIREAPTSWLRIAWPGRNSSRVDFSSATPAGTSRGRRECWTTRCSSTAALDSSRLSPH